MLMDDKEWNPHEVEMGGNRAYSDEIRISEMNRSYGDSFEYESDLVLGAISHAFNQHTFADRLIASVQIVGKAKFINSERLQVSCLISEVKTNTRHSAHTPERVSRVFGIGLHKVKQTLAVTTQQGIRHAVNPLNRRYRVDHLDLHRTYLKGQWYLDHITAKTKSLHQNTGTWLYTNGHFTSCYPTVTRGEASNTLNEFCNIVGTPARLKSDRVPELVGRHTPFLKLLGNATSI